MNSAGQKSSVKILRFTALFNIQYNPLGVILIGRMHLLPYIMVIEGVSLTKIHRQWRQLPPNIFLFKINAFDDTTKKLLKKCVVHYAANHNIYIVNVQLPINLRDHKLGGLIAKP